MFLTYIVSDSLCMYRQCEDIEYLADAFSLVVFIVVFCSFSIFIISCMVVLLLETVTKKSKQVVINKDKHTAGVKKCDVCLSAYSFKSFPQHRMFCSREKQAWLAKLPKTVDHSCKAGHQLSLWPEQQLDWVCVDKECGTRFSCSDGRNRFSCYPCQYDLCYICIMNGKNSLELEQDGKKEQMIFFPDKKWIKGFAMASASPEAKHVLLHISDQ